MSQNSNTMDTIPNPEIPDIHDENIDENKYIDTFSKREEESYIPLIEDEKYKTDIMYQSLTDQFNTQRGGGEGGIAAAIGLGIIGVPIAVATILGGAVTFVIGAAVVRLVLAIINVPTRYLNKLGRDASPAHDVKKVLMRPINFMKKFVKKSSTTYGGAIDEQKTMTVSDVVSMFVTKAALHPNEVIKQFSNSKNSVIEQDSTIEEKFKVIMNLRPTTGTMLSLAMGGRRGALTLARSRDAIRALRSILNMFEKLKTIREQMFNRTQWAGSVEMKNAAINELDDVKNIHSALDSTIKIMENEYVNASDYTDTMKDQLNALRTNNNNNNHEKTTFFKGMFGKIRDMTKIGYNCGDIYSVYEHELLKRLHVLYANEADLNNDIKQAANSSKSIIIDNKSINKARSMLKGISICKQNMIMIIRTGRSEGTCYNGVKFGPELGLSYGSRIRKQLLIFDKLEKIYTDYCISMKKPGTPTNQEARVNQYTNQEARVNQYTNQGSRVGGKMKTMKATDERVLINNKNLVVYVGPRGGKYIRRNKKYVSLAKLKKPNKT